MELASKCAISRIDPYLILGLQRQFFLDSNIIETAFRRAAATHHPDQAGGSQASFQELQGAIAILRDPAKRLRYLAGISEPHSIPLPSTAMTLFPMIISSLQKTDALIKKYQTSSGALAKALLSEELLQEYLNLQQPLEQVKEWESLLHQQLQAWDVSPSQPSSQELLELANQFTFAQRWLQQLSERELLLKTLVG